MRMEGQGRWQRPASLAGLLAAAILGFAACDGSAQAPEEAAEAAPAPDPLVAVPPAPGPRPQAIVSVRDHGELRIELLPDVAPATVAHFVRLAGEGFYDGTTFHRVIPGFMIQGGDPLSRDRDPRNDGKGNADEQIADEFSELSTVPGIVALANRGRADTGSGQFFIAIDEDRSLDGRYAIFGHLLEGLEIAEAIAEVERDLYGRHGPTNRPLEDVVIESVRIVPAATNTASAEAGAGSAPETPAP